MHRNKNLKYLMLHFNLSLNKLIILFKCLHLIFTMYFLQFYKDLQKKYHYNKYYYIEYNVFYRHIVYLRQIKQNY